MGWAIWAIYMKEWKGILLLFLLARLAPKRPTFPRRASEASIKKILTTKFQLDFVAESVTQATGGLESCGWYESGSLINILACRLGVRAKAGVNMVSSWELELSRLSNEMRNGRGRKLSSLKYPHQSVVGSHL